MAKIQGAYEETAPGKSTEITALIFFPISWVIWGTSVTVESKVQFFDEIIFIEV